MFEFKKAKRHKAKLRLAICAPSGAGKTYSALLIAKGMGGSVCVIDTENGSAELYDKLLDYDCGTIAPPFSPKRYVEAIHAAENAGYDIIIIDSLTHAWAGQGGILSEVDKRKGPGNDFGAWRDVTPMHDDLVNAMLQSTAHIIVTMRTKTAYELEKNDKGKLAPVKKGMAPIQRDGLEYEFTVVFDIEDAKKHMATAGKDRTSLFDGQYFIPNEDTGKQLMTWLNSGDDALAGGKPLQPINVAGYADFLAQVADINELKAEYNMIKADPRYTVSDQKAINAIFNARKAALAEREAA